MTGSKVVALGHYQPERVLTNAELATMVDTSDEWIQSQVGIKERRIAAPGEQVDEMAWRAAEKAIANSASTSPSSTWSSSRPVLRSTTPPTSPPGWLPGSACPPRPRWT